MTKCSKCDKTITKEDRNWFGSTKFCPHCEEENISDGYEKWVATKTIPIEIYQILLGKAKIVTH